MNVHHCKDTYCNMHSKLASIVLVMTMTMEPARTLFVAESTKTLDCECYEIAQAGTAGSDICATTIKTITASMAEYTFTITDAGLVAGDLLRVFLQAKLEGDSNGVLKVEIGGARMMLDIKG